MPEQHWSVTVSLEGEDIVTIEPRMLSGREIGPDEEAAIRTAALHLLSFIGEVHTPKLKSLGEDIGRYRIRIAEVLLKYNITLPDAPLDMLALAMHKMGRNA